VLVDEVVGGRLGNLSVESVGGYLPKALEWRVDAKPGIQVQVAAARDMVEVMVMSTEVTLPLDPEMPLVYSGTWVEHLDIVVGEEVAV